MMRAPYPYPWRTAVAIAVTAALLMVTAPAAATPRPGRPAGVDDDPAGGAAATVTLLTGDVVTVAEAAPGRYAATVEPAPGREAVDFHTMEVDGGMLVLPADVVPHLAAGRVDRRLFDVRQLVADGYDDASTARLPLIVRGGGGDPAVATLAGGGPVTPLASIDAAAVAPARDTLADFWQRLAGDPATAGTPSALAHGVSRVWLDAPVAATLDRSTAQVGAPAAWDAGYDGTGTTIAVLDTGVDADHPDLTGKVVAAENFTGSPGTGDVFGHGTHVAGIAAGTGAAAGGARRGVAPGADLLNGKVLGDRGTGSTSWIIAGMEWAVAQGADVVNMSLGGGVTDGTDPLSQAVNRLSAESDTLFVISAGNDGQDYAVGAPGAATAALTVGAVDRDDTLAPFSSRGPRQGDDALKPEITAPGVDIMSARAEGVTVPGEEHYFPASGTSMAAPHVTGAAALLAQADPDRDGEGLKDALVSTADPHPDLDIHAQGAGRLDAARAATQRVYATGVVDFALREQPEPGAAPLTGELAYTNDTGDPVTLALAAELTNLEGGRDSSGAVTLDRDEVTVPAGETVTVGLAVDLGALGRGRNGGAVTATGPEGTVVARTLLGVSLRGPVHDVTFRAEHADGSPAGATIFTAHGDNPRSDVVATLNGESTFRLEEGTYQINGLFPDHTPQFEQRMLVTDPVLEVTGDRVVALRPDTAVPVRIETPRLAEQRAVHSMYTHRRHGNGRGIGFGTMSFSGVRQMNVTPTAAVSEGEYEFVYRAQLHAPQVTASVPALTDPLELRLLGLPLDELEDARMRHPLVYAGTGTAEELAAAGVDGAVALIESDTNEVFESDLAQAAAEAGAVAVVFVRPESQSPWTAWKPTRGIDEWSIPAVVATYETGARLIAHARSRSATVDLTLTLASPYLYDVVLVEQDRVPSEVVHRVTTGNYARIPVEYGHGGGYEWISEQRFGWRPWQEFAWNDGSRWTRAGGTREEWVSAGDIRWQHRVNYHLSCEFTFCDSTALSGGLAAPIRGYQPGRQDPVTWYHPVVRPAAVPSMLSTRTGDVFDLRIPEFVDADGHPGFAEQGSFGGPPPDQVSARLFAGGELVEVLPDASFQQVAVDPAAARYRLELSVAREASPDWRRGTRTDTAWEFSSGRVTGPAAPLPLLQVDYRVPADAAGTVAGSPRPHRLELTFRHQDGLPAPRTSRVTVEYSFDGGETWRPARVSGVGRPVVAVRIPGGEGTVSLRVHAEATDGTAITQTVHHAYTFR